MRGGDVDPAVLADVCGDEPSWVCEQVLDATSGNEFLARAADFLLARPLTILLIVLVAVVVNGVVRRAIRRFVERLSGTMSAARATARAHTIGAVLKSGATAVIYGLAALLALGELGINLGPLIAGAGIAGVAIGFGAQSLVRDFLSGFFMLVEDQYGVGDIVDVGEVNGTVEAVTLRATRIRDVDGTVWHVPNGEIKRVGNKSQQWARALIDIPVVHGTDVRHAEQVIKRVADELWREDGWDRKILEEPEVSGVESLGVDGVVIRLVVKTLPDEQFGVMRELRRRLKEAFDRERIEMPMAARSVVLASSEPPPARKRAAAATKKRPAAATKQGRG